ncbi:putative mitochondrial protein AtMg00860 [Silene latifolia]|uniref:putative mitochondrial protein AtMg00860 n=1 Tax=Silene latifolia TaxID=37657 RepID=UPI003D77E6D3
MDQMNRTFSEFLDKCAVVFIDDILSFSKSKEEYAAHLRTILEEGVMLDPSKIEAVMEWKSPTDVGEIRSFFGLAGYYRRIVKDFSKLARPMTQPLKKETKFLWIEACEEAFQELKRRLTTAPVLTLPEDGVEFDVFCDASKMGLGCVLMQNRRVVAYTS